MVYKLMVVDDSNIIRNRIKRGFNAMQFELVATASNGVEALEQFKRHGPDVVTMDFRLVRQIHRHQSLGIGRLWVYLQAVYRR
jgi:chemotaxis response regulator CheB